MSTTPNVLPLPKKADTSEGFDARRRIADTHTPELVIALCGPLGTPLHRAAAILRDLLNRSHGYPKVDTIRLSEFIRKHKNLDDKAGIKELIEAGNELRKKHGNSVLAQLAIKRINEARDSSEKKGPQEKQAEMFEGRGDAIEPSPVVRHCHIIDSIKNDEELGLLRSVYGDLLHLISVYTPITLRVNELKRRYPSTGDVYQLIDRDSGEETTSGQTVRAVFPRADFFLRLDDGTDDQIRTNLERYLNLVMGSGVVTPTHAERAMYAAHSAARNSACLSRQVGAAIADVDGGLLSVGWNDVPRAHGGLYESTSSTEPPQADHRCWNKDGGKCFNDEEKTEISSKLASVLQAEGIIEKEALDDVASRLRKSKELSGLIEFSRAVHAELHALLNAGRSNGNRIQGSRLFVTTYPCHSCARHIIAAGVSEVRYIEPYRKSLAIKLHSDAISEDESDTGKVRILPFDGVSPTRYLKLFEEHSAGRKDPRTGRMIQRRDSLPVTTDTLEAIATLEALALKQLVSSGLMAT
ncbi:anti-phage dCTP deaminase [Dyella koreensis]|uniref:Cytidine deaminase n=1 Tax=Dyella koreensis TaxID=311235 RepID=A0ABW8K6V5_9GAMM